MPILKIEIHRGIQTGRTVRRRRLPTVLLQHAVPRG